MRSGVQRAFKMIDSKARADALGSEKYNKKVHHSLPLLFITMFVD